MNYEGLVKYVRDAGCRVIVYKNKGSLKGDSCAGYFERKTKGPFICMAIEGMSEISCCELLIHEFCHYLQWKDGTETPAIDDAYEDWDKWLTKNKKLTAERIEEIRQVILTHEWDAEIRSVSLGKNLNVKGYRPASILRGANAYMSTIKWSFQTHQTSPWTPERSKFKPLVLTKEELLRPLSERELKKMDKLMKALNVTLNLPSVETSHISS
jgi:hypothetical protein